MKYNRLILACLIFSSVGVTSCLSVGNQDEEHGESNVVGRVDGGYKDAEIETGKELDNGVYQASWSIGGKEYTLHYELEYKKPMNVYLNDGSRPQRVGAGIEDGEFVVVSNDKDATGEIYVKYSVYTRTGFMTINGQHHDIKVNLKFMKNNR